jgi:sugar phosphate isomerase/epimerase
MVSTKELQPLEPGLCSWCLHLTDVPALEGAMASFGLRALHLALAPIAELPASEQTHVIAQLQASPLIITCGMISYHREDYTTRETIHATGGLVPDTEFEARYRLTINCGHVAHKLGLTQISTHVGFIPDPSDTANFEKIRARLAQVADEYAKLGISLIFETGQETAETLTAFLKTLGRTNVGVNFDPANMLSYDKGDPVKAVHTLAPWIKHVHAKDSKRVVPVPTDEASWRGREVPLGEGDANLPGVIRALKEIGYKGPLIIERESGKERHADIEKGIAFLRKHI